MKEKTPLFSIIVPVYNAERFLRECLDSILYQTEKDFDAFIIDDGSTDSSTEISKEYAEKYPDLFTYIRQDNKGLGGARNTGLKHADGKYSIFLDSDDFIASHSIERLHEFIDELDDDPEIILTLPYIYNNVTKTYLDFYDKDALEWIFRESFSLSADVQPFLLSLEASFWRCIWKTSFLREQKLAFFEHTAWEDVPPHFSLFKHAKKITEYSNTPVFYYRTNNSGQITSGSGKTRLDVPKVFSEVIDKMIAEQWPIEQKVEVYKVMHTFIFWSVSVIDDQYRRDMIESLHRMYKKIPWSELIKFYKITHPKKKVFLMGVFIKSNCFYKIMCDRAKTKLFFNRFKKLAKAD